MNRNHGSCTALLLVSLVGCEPRPEVGDYRVVRVDCLTVDIGGDLVVPFGLEPLECEQAQYTLESLVADERISVMAGECSLQGLGPTARFVCEDALQPLEWPEVMDVQGRPLRDAEGRIEAFVALRKHPRITIESHLIAEGVVRLSNRCAQQIQSNRACQHLRDLLEK